jgi:hypothetical protein
VTELLARTLPLARWHISAASVRGSAHGDGVPNQDAVASAEFATPSGFALWVAAVSDGHGGRRYVRSERGSRLAAELAVATMRTAAGLLGRSADLASVLRASVPEIVAAWRAAVLADSAANPFTEQERLRAGGADLAADPLIAYGSTLLVAALWNGHVALAQLGDGDVLVRSRGSLGSRPVPGDHRLVGGETTSLCLPSAVQDFRYAALDPAEDVDLVLLASDGYANSFADEHWWQAVIDDVAGFVTRSSARALDAQLPSWLADSAVMGGDDVTAAVLTREPMAAERAATPRPAAGAAPEPPPPEAVPSRSHRRQAARSYRRKLTVILVALALALVAVIALVVLLVSASDPDHPRSPGAPGSNAPPAQQQPSQVPVRRSP